MKKVIVLVLSIAFGLSGCGFSVDTDNPLRGKSTEERIIMSLEKTYPEHTFTMVKEFSDGYAICADEDGLEFLVDTMIYNNTYHFGCYDKYFKEVLFQQDYLSNVERIAEENAYGIEYDEENETITLEVDIVNHDVDLRHVIETSLQILNSVEYVPQVVYPETGFSTRVVNYYTIPEMYNLNIFFLSSASKEVMTCRGISFSERDMDVEILVERMEEALQTAYNQEEYFFEEYETEDAMETRK